MHPPDPYPLQGETGLHVVDVEVTSETERPTGGGDIPPPDPPRTVKPKSRAKPKAKPKVVPTQTALTVSFTAEVKCNLGVETYESGTARIFSSETWNVEGCTPAQCAKLYTDRYAFLKEDIDKRIMDEYKEMSCFVKAENHVEPKEN